jgi:hypothetical protein
MCEREVVRMLKIVRHLFFNSGSLLEVPVMRKKGSYVDT